MPETDSITKTCETCGTEFHPQRNCVGRFCSMACRRAETPETRFWRQVNKFGPIPECRPDLGPCWLWTSSLDKRLGYTKFRCKGKKIPAHRFSYELEHGKVPEGLELDHLCRVRHCVRPSHLEAVTHKVNCLRGTAPAAQFAKQTHCIKGHPLISIPNSKYPQRICRICRRESGLRWYYRNYKGKHRQPTSP